MQPIPLPYPPSNNTYKRHICTVDRRHRVSAYPTARATSYKEEVQARMVEAGYTQPFEGDVAVFVTAYRPRRQGDLDNVLKVVLDALQGFAYRNDSQIAVVVAKRFEDRTNPRIEVSVHPVD